jgi:integrase
MIAISRFAKLLARAGDEAKIGFKVHPHMLRHACGSHWPTRASIRER